MLTVSDIEKLGTQYSLLCSKGQAPDGLPEAYLYSHDMKYRYVFARWGMRVLWICGWD